MKTLGFTQIRDGIGSTYRGILGAYTTNFRSKQHKLESRAWLTKGEDTITKGIMYLGKNLMRFFVYEGHCLMIKQLMDPAIHNEADVSINIQSE